MRRVDRAKVSVTAASDVVLRTLGATLVGLLAFPLGYHPKAIRRSMEARGFYEPLARAGDASKFFATPPRDVPVELEIARGSLFRPEDGVCEDLRFESPFQPVFEGEREPYLRHRENRIAHARMWRHRHGPRPTVIALHGFSADLYHLNEWFFALPWLYSMGCDVVCLTLPFHGQRQTRFSPFSGHGFFAGGLPRLNEAFAQAVYDVRILIDWLEKQGASSIGVTGVSLGGFTSALLANVEPRLQFAIPNVPVVSIADLVLEWEPIGIAARTTMKLFHQRLADIRAVLAPSSPLTFRPVIPRERRFIIGGVADRLAPPKHARLLWEHWDRCRIHWFPGSHLVHLDRGDYLRQMARFLGEHSFLPPRGQGRVESTPSRSSRK
jgi:pimeloyl-ACP methyl ester carboxylesterase